MNFILDWFREMSLAEATGWVLAENIFLFLFAIVLGQGFVWWFADRRVIDAPDPLQWQEMGFAAVCVLFNAIITLAGWWLWTHDYITIRRDIGWRAWSDVLVLLLSMDFAMYWFHRAAHIRWLYPLVHVTHHRYDKPRPLNLFVLNPIEVMGFGGLWLIVLCVFNSSWLGICIYLALNLLFGIVGHAGVEPFPRRWLKLPLLRFVGTSTFHAEHHQQAGTNFGFYTTLWDRIFGTVDPRYP
jgi:sterol desaturase/sphingolipid hydroxylase (fatty acid hydroxylase superfamily)